MADITAYTQYYSKGVELFDAGHYGEALNNFKKVLVLQPEFPDAYFKIACVYGELEHFADAFSMFDKVQNLLPNDLEIHFTYGKTLLKAGQDKKGIKMLNKALKMNSRDPRARMEIARYYMHNEKLRKALSTVESGIKANPDYAPFYAFAGDILRRQNKLPKAQSYYEQCLEIDPDQETAKRGFNSVIRAMENNSTGKVLSPEEEAKEDMLEAAGLYAEGRYDEVIIRLLDLKERSGVELEASMLLGLAFVRKGLYKRAHDALLTFAKEHSADILVLYNLGLAANRMGRYDNAIEYLNDALAMDKDFEEALIEMGIACQMTGDMAAAQRFFLRALKINRRDPRPYAYLARMAYDKNEKDKVDEFLKRAQSCSADHPSIQFMKGYAAIVENEYELAVELLISCLEQAPDHFEALKLLGRARLELHDFEGVKESYQAAAALNPSDSECREVLNELAAQS